MIIRDVMVRDMMKRDMVWRDPLYRAGAPYRVTLDHVTPFHVT